MKVASLELCNRLHQLTEWKYPEFSYLNDDLVSNFPGARQTNKGWIPAYDLGFMLPKLPGWMEWSLTRDLDGFYTLFISDLENSKRFDADTPEDAVAKALIWVNGDKA